MSTITVQDKEAFQQRIEKGLRAEAVPVHMHDGYLLYFLEGILPGSFGTAVLENNLSEAVGRADSTNAAALANHVRFLYDYAPIGSWGNEANVANWVKRHRLEREAQVEV